MGKQVMVDNDQEFVGGDELFYIIR